MKKNRVLRTQRQSALLKKLFGISIFSSLVWVCIGKTTPAQMDIRPDDTLVGESSTLDIQGNTTFIEGGATRGINLFNSFEEFNIAEGAAAYFVVDNAAIENIFSRITGSDPSDILGTLGTCLSGACPNTKTDATLYFMNPNGILFGPDASLDTGGSFVATTANGVEFGNRGIFDTSASKIPSQLLAVSPSAFFFSQVLPARIVNNSIAPAGVSNSGISVFGLSVPSGESLLLLGGNIEMEGGSVYSSGGQLELGGVAEPSEVKLNVTDSGLSLTFSEETSLSDVVLKKDALVALFGSGNITVNAELLSAEGGGRLVAVTENEAEGGDITLNTAKLECSGFGSFPSGAYTQAISNSNGDVGDIVINADSVDIIEDAVIVSSANNTTSSDVGNIDITTDRFFATDGGRVVNIAFGPGNGGYTTIDSEEFTISGVGQSRVRTGVYSQTLFSGNGGNITIDANSFNASMQAEVQNTVLTGATGDAGLTIITVIDTLSLTDDAIIRSETFGAGRGGDISIFSNQFIAQSGGQISGGSGREDFSGNFGPGGNVTIEATSSIELEDTSISTNSRRSGIFSETASASRAGNLTITTGRLTVLSGAAVSSGAVGSGSLGGDGGDISIFASEEVEVIGQGIRPSSITTEANPLEDAVKVSNAGNLFISARQLRIQDGGAVQSLATAEPPSTGSRANAGNVTLRISDSVEVSGEDSYISSGLLLNTIGRGGNIDIRATSLSVSDGASIDSETRGIGNAGNVKLDASSIFLDEATISALSSDTGLAGNILISAGQSLALTDSNIITEALNSSGGDIRVSKRDNTEGGLILLRDSDITTNSLGDGGNISLLMPTVAFGDSDILARSQSANGGGITLSAFFSNNIAPDSQQMFDGNDKVDINADGQIASGNIVIPDTSFIQSGLNELPDRLIHSDGLVAESCIVRRSLEGGALSISNAENLPEPLSGSVATTYPTGRISTIASEPPEALSEQLGDTIAEPQGVYRLDDGRLVMSRECL